MLEGILGKDTQCLGTPLKCLLIAGMIMFALVITVIMPIIGLPLDVVVLLITAFLGKDMFGFSGLFKGGMFK